jgi:hypothetical protein
MTFITELERGIDAQAADEGNGRRLVLIQYFLNIELKLVY